jgi:hypothetical protein
MVSTRSTRSSTKHEAPRAEKEVPAKKQKTTKGTGKASTKNGDEEMQPEKETSKGDVTINEETKTESKEPETTHNGKEENGSADKQETKSAEAHTKNGDAKQDSGKSE